MIEEDGVPGAARWRRTTLGKLCAGDGGGIQTGPFGSQLHASDYVETGIPSVMPQNIGDNTIIEEGIARITSEDAIRLEKYRLRDGDIVYARRGDVGKRSLVRVQNDGWLCGTGCLRVRVPSQIENDPAFLSYLLGTSEARDWIVRHAVGATMPNLNTSILGAVPLRVPQIKVQLAIAEVLGALDDKIAANRGVAEVGEELLVAHFDQLGLDGEDPDGLVPITTLIEVNPLVPRPVEAEPVYVDMQALPTNGMSISSWSSRPPKGGARFQNGDTLLARITPCLENRKTGFVDFLAEGQVGLGSTEYVVMRTRNGVPPVLSYFLAVSERFRTFAIRHMVGTSGRQRVGAEVLREYEIRLPGREELERFGALSERIASMVASVRTENQLLAETRDVLLPELMSGRLSVKDAEKQVESVV